MNVNELKTPDIEKEIKPKNDSQSLTHEQLMKNQSKKENKKQEKKEGKVIRLELRDIKPYARNAKIHTEKQVAAIRDSIITFGYKTLIQVDENNVVLSGHGRLRALWQIDSSGTKEIPVLQISDLNESEKKAFRIVDNKTNTDTGYDLDILRGEFEELEDTDNLEDTGFTMDEIIEIRDKEHDKTKVHEHDRELNKQNLCPKCGYDLRKK